MTSIHVHPLTSPLKHRFHRRWLISGKWFGSKDASFWWRCVDSRRAERAVVLATGPRKAPKCIIFTKCISCPSTSGQMII